VHTFQKEGRNLQHFCREAVRHMRNLLIARTCGADSEMIAATPDQRPALAKAAALFSEEDLTRFFQILLQTDEDLRRKPDPRVHLEMGLLRLINAARLAPLEELLAELKGGAPGRSVGSGTSRGATAPPAFAPAPKSVATSFVPPASPWPTVEARTQTLSPFAASATATASAASAIAPMAIAPSNNVRVEEEEKIASQKTNGANMPAIGISQEHVAEIKAGIQAQQKFLGELLEQSSRWELEGAELRIYFADKNRTFADLIEGRDSLEKIRTLSSKVLGRAVRVCAKLEAVAAATASSASSSSSSTQELRAQFERDPMVRSMLQRFGGKISEVKRSQEES
jgi:DNA polymerase-3 subunit gamma/tau